MGAGLLDNGKLRIQGAGHIKVNLHRPVEGTIKTITVKREAGRWFVIFQCGAGYRSASGQFRRNRNRYRAEQFRRALQWCRDSESALLSQSRSPVPPCQRKVARRKNKRSNRRRKAVRDLQRAHVHVRNQRRDFQHKVSRQLVNEYGVIAVEDLNVKGLAGGMLAKSVHDAGWSMFVVMLSYKAECAGRKLVKVDASGTSQTCPCGASVPKTLADRWHDCPACGLSAGRDHVSARVILSRARCGLSGANVEVVVSCVS